MKTEEIIKGNKLIAKFMGFENLGLLGFTNLDYWNIPDEDNPIPDTNLKFHFSFDWLMPVVEKIEETNYVKIVKKHCAINKTDHNEFNEWASYEGMSFAPHPDKITAVWTAVVKYIKWYNNQKKE